MIDHDGAVPVYRQLAAILQHQIASGELAPGRPLPSIKTLSQRYEIAKGSVEKAIQLLRDEGLVRTTIGRGVYVIPPGERGLIPPGKARP
ncbi:GntR family transcriptional regulator [Trebonia sp.]|uniref:GntR family transcriptional regulator n=1 Tax=Trebonia sp. TaxID=2767075 RepID=UPI0026212914|nr:winged helix-turn-helix domain-containing protein [Trebonia sp.]